MFLPSFLRCLFCDNVMISLREATGPKSVTVDSSHPYFIQMKKTSMHPLNSTAFEWQLSGCKRKSRVKSGAVCTYWRKMAVLFCRTPMYHPQTWTQNWYIMKIITSLWEINGRSIYVVGVTLEREQDISPALQIGDKIYAVLSNTGGDRLRALDSQILDCPVEIKIETEKDSGVARWYT